MGRGQRGHLQRELLLVGRQRAHELRPFGFGLLQRTFGVGQPLFQLLPGLDVAGVLPFHLLLEGRHLLLCLFPFLPGLLQRRGGAGQLFLQLLDFGRVGGVQFGQLVGQGALIRGQGGQRLFLFDACPFQRLPGLRELLPEFLGGLFLARLQIAQLSGETLLVAAEGGDLPVLLPPDLFQRSRRLSQLRLQLLDGPFMVGRKGRQPLGGFPLPGGQFRQGPLLGGEIGEGLVLFGAGPVQRAHGLGQLRLEALDGLITRGRKRRELLRGVLFAGGEVGEGLVLFGAGLVQRPRNLRQLLLQLCQGGFLGGDFRFQGLLRGLQIRGFGVQARDGTVLPCDLVLEPAYSRGQLVAPPYERGEVLFQLGLGGRKKRVLLHQGVSEAGQFPSLCIQFPHRGGSLVEPGGKVVGGLERIVPFGRQGGHSPAIAVHGPAPFFDGGAQFLPDLGQGVGQLPDLPPGVGKLPVALVEHALAPAYVLRQLVDSRFKGGNLAPALLQVLRQSGVVRLHALLLGVQLLVFLDGDARGHDHGQRHRNAKNSRVVCHYRHPFVIRLSRRCGIRGDRGPSAERPPQRPRYEIVTLPIRLGRQQATQEITKLRHMSTAASGRPCRPADAVPAR